MNDHVVPGNLPASTVPVSVIIPCFECAGTIVRAIDSVRAQSAQPLEVILIDDCSPSKETTDALGEIAALYPDWVVLRRSSQNMGPGSARNIGWSIARGTFIAFLDSDDIWHSDKIKVQYEWMTQHPHISLTSHGGLIVSSRDDLERHRGNHPLVAREINPRQQFLRNRHATRCVMVRASLPNRFQEGKRYSEDYLLWSEIGLSGGRMAYLNAKLAGSFRQPFSSGGLSGNLWRMQLGGWEAQAHLFKSGKVSLLLFGAASVFGAVRFSRRLVVAAWRRAKGRLAQ